MIKLCMTTMTMDSETYMIFITKPIAGNLHILHSLLHSFILFIDTQCPAPYLNAPYVDITNQPANGFVIGFTADIGCVPGYEHTGIFITTCQEDGSWSNSALPTCTSKLT